MNPTTNQPDHNPTISRRASMTGDVRELPAVALREFDLRGTGDTAGSYVVRSPKVLRVFAQSHFGWRFLRYRIARELYALVIDPFER